MLGGNNYLGLTGDERVKQAAREALDRYGTGVTGSRFMNGTLPLHLELERELAEWMGTDDALVYTAGYLANTGCIATLLGPEDTVICDSGDHASILDAVAMSRARVRPFRHGRLERLETMLERAESDGGGVLVVVDGIFSMEGDLPNLPEIARLCREHGARLMVDEAHAVGVLGARGTGATEAYGVEDEVDLRMGTFSKSLASCGGFIAGPAVLFWKALYDAGVYVNVGLYPAVDRGGALLRTSVMPTHEREQLDRALEAFERVKHSVPGEPPAQVPS